MNRSDRSPSAPPTPTGSTLAAQPTAEVPTAVAERYDAALIDLDGVIYRGDQVVPAARATVAELRTRQVKVLFLTNNSARTPGQVADKLAALGIEANAGDVLTSAVATASMLRSEGAAGSSAFVIGERGIREALEEVGVQVVDGAPDRSDLVVVGWDRSVDYAKLRTASLLVERGARLVATNGDASYPAPNGLWPGAGAIVAAVSTTTGVDPVVVGKPAKPMFEAAARALGAEVPLVVGDRLETDVDGAITMGWDSLLVLSGAARPADLLRTWDLPTYVGPDLSLLLDDPPPARFRPATRSDLPEVRRLLSSSSLRADAVEDRLDGTVVAEYPERSGRIVATACLEEVGGDDATGRQNRFGLLRSVAVRPDLRGKGLGLLATAAAVRSGRVRGIVHVSLFTETAEGFFRRLGFETGHREGLPTPVALSAHAAEECASAVAMSIELSPLDS